MDLRIICVYIKYFESSVQKIVGGKFDLTYASIISIISYFFKIFLFAPKHF
jgi:hypothetical protein